VELMERFKELVVGLSISSGLLVKPLNDNMRIILETRDGGLSVYECSNERLGAFKRVVNILTYAKVIKPEDRAINQLAIYFECIHGKCYSELSGEELEVLAECMLSAFKLKIIEGVVVLDVTGGKEHKRKELGPPSKPPLQYDSSL